MDVRFITFVSYLFAHRYTAVNNIDKNLYEKVLKASEILTRDSTDKRPNLNTRTLEDCEPNCDRGNVTTVVNKNTSNSQNHTSESIAGR